MTWELILDGYSESSYSATPRFAAARLPWFTDKTLSRKPGAVHCVSGFASMSGIPGAVHTNIPQTVDFGTPRRRPATTRGKCSSK
ncbi:invasion plasmid antigen (plasmid) [Shigella flexneri 2002017]|uniref:IS629 orf n=1 Tax=Shigella flexneri serotype 5a (strain M90T) TaxID=1086030 RepID=Q9AFU6_SHIFM|nr:IS629 orf, fragment [Shigella flexneri 5a str. M90T]ADA76827.1 invasion plasmid antigen [Shigella flexneri 2002017]